jgi:hypothetical protein
LNVAPFGPAAWRKKVGSGPASSRTRSRARPCTRDADAPEFLAHGGAPLLRQLGVKLWQMQRRSGARRRHANLGWLARNFAGMQHRLFTTSGLGHSPENALVAQFVIVLKHGRNGITATHRGRRVEGGGPLRRVARTGVIAEALRPVVPAEVLPTARAAAAAVARVAILLDTPIGRMFRWRPALSQRL